jgi:hypothetical protein
VELAPAPVLVDTDPGRIRQVLDGLCENALRIVPAGAPLVLAVRAGERGGVIEVRDGGPGFTDDDLAVAFDRGALHQRYRGIRKVGSGVGLALAARLVSRLGGTIEAGHAAEGRSAVHRRRSLPDPYTTLTGPVHERRSLHRMTRNLPAPVRTALTLSTLGLTGLLALSACGAGAGAPTGTAGTSSGGGAVAVTELGDLDGETLALTAVGLETGLEQAPAPAASGDAAARKADKAGQDRKAGQARKLLRKNTPHGAVTLQTKKGVKTVVVQRGAVTAVDATTVTVKSTDGFTTMWMFADQLKVRKDKQAA